MHKSTTSILLASMMVVSGFAVAQTTPAPVQAQGGATTVAPAADAGTMPNTRADVKSEINTRSGAKVGAPAQGGGTPSGAAKTGASGGMSNSRADVKADIPKGSKAGASVQGDSSVSGAPAAGAKSSTSAERKAARAERKAARKAKHEAAANSTGKGLDTGPSSTVKTAPQ
jgi:hypothetical protein